jgi:metallo-beta-lactamase class B
MNIMRSLLTLLLVTASLSAEVPKDWTTPLDPFKIAGNLYYVGSRDLAAYLIVTPAGNILINSNLETSPPQIRHSVEQLGFKWSDIKILLSSQAHYDHVAGAAQVVRETHAMYEVMQGDVAVVEGGGGKTSFDLPARRRQDHPGRNQHHRASHRRPHPGLHHLHDGRRRKR